MTRGTTPMVAPTNSYATDGVPQRRAGHLRPRMASRLHGSAEGSALDSATTASARLRSPRRDRVAAADT